MVDLVKSWRCGSGRGKIHRFCSRMRPDFTAGAGTGSSACFRSATAWRWTRGATAAAVSPSCRTTGASSDTTWRRWRSTGTCATPSALAIPAAGIRTVQAAALRPQTYRALLLIDPTIFPLEYYGTAAPDASFTLRRRNVWASPDEMFERFKGRLRFPTGGRRSCAITATTVCCRGMGQLVLACPPAVEASIYLNSKSRGSNIYARGRADPAACGRDARGQGTAARNLRSGRVAHGVGPGLAIRPWARHRTAGRFALHSHGSSPNG